MKTRVTALILSTLLVGTLVAESVQAASNSIVGSPKLEVLVDGRKVEFQGGDPVAESARVQVPLRGVGEALGAEVSYNDAGQKVTYSKGDKAIVLTIDRKQAMVDGRTVTMDTAAKAVKGRTYVPLRFVSENLGVPVNWDQTANWVWIGSKEIPTLEEAGVQNVPISKFTKLIGENEALLTSAFGVKYTTVNVIKADQLPLKIGDEIIYDLWPVKQGSVEGLKMRVSDGSPSITFLGSKFDAKKRAPLKSLSVKNPDTTRTVAYPIVFGNDIDVDPNYKSFKLSQVEYFALSSISVDALTIIENPFK